MRASTEVGGFPKYPEIVLLVRRPEIFAVKEVVATEKLQGSTFRVHFPSGMTGVDDVLFGSHSIDHVPGEDFPLMNAVAWFEARRDLLATMWETIKSYEFPDATIFGEAYGPGIKAKGVKYSAGQSMFFRAFDIMVGQNFVTYDLFVEIADKMKLPRVHEVWRGAPSMEAFDALLEKPSCEAQINGIDDPKNVAEGVVVRSNPLMRNVFGEWLIAKHKAKKFSEVVEPTAPKIRGATPADAFAAKFVTEGRVSNVIGWIHDRGIHLKGDMTDMPSVIEAMIGDLRKECASEWAGTGCSDKQIIGAISKVLAPIYRKMIA